MIGKVTNMMLTKTMPMLTKMMGEVGVQMARGVKAAAWNVNRRQCCAAAHIVHKKHTLHKKHILHRLHTR